MTELTPEQVSQLHPWSDKWVQNALSTKEMDDEDFDAMRTAVPGLYGAANLTPPPNSRILFVTNPFIASFAAGFSSAIWQMRKEGIKIKSPKSARLNSSAGHQVLRTVCLASDLPVPRIYKGSEGPEETSPESWYSYPIKEMETIADILGDASKLLNGVSKSWQMRLGGNQWSGWASFLTFFRYVVKLDIDFSNWHPYEMSVIHAGPQYVHEQFVIISDRPSRLNVDIEFRPHDENRAFCQYRDGSGLFAIRGVRMPRWVVETQTEKLNPMDLMKMKNAEQRQIFVQKVGIERCWHKMATVIDKHGEYELGDLPLGEGRNGRYLKMHNPSVEEVWHIEGVGNECGTVQEALHWRKPEEMRKIPVRDDGDDWYQQGDVPIWPKGAKALKPMPSKLT